MDAPRPRGEAGPNPSHETRVKQRVRVEDGVVSDDVLIDTDVCPKEFCRPFLAGREGFVGRLTWTGELLGI